MTGEPNVLADQARAMYQDRVGELEVELPGGDITLPVRVLEVRYAYGRVDALVTPAGDGDGEAWVNLDRITF